MTSTIFENAKILDTKAGSYSHGSVRVEGGRIAEVSSGALSGSADRRIDLGGKVLMPGLCDGHVHVIAITAGFPDLIRSSPFYVMSRASKIMNEMLMRGFTTVRDAGGADYGIARAVDEGHVAGPRVLFCGHALSQTGGHGDMRSPGDIFEQNTMIHASLGVICDGVPEVRRACREEIRRGAHHIKIMASGGVSSPTDRIDSDQFSREEIAACVEEAQMANLYVMAHAYTARSVSRCAELGVRTVEHCNRIDDATAKLMRERGTYMVPTLSTYQALKDEGLANGLSHAMLAKLDDVIEAGIRAVDMGVRAGVTQVYGTDLLGNMHRHQLNEFTLRSEVVTNADLVRAATCNAAEAFMADGDFGVIAEGARGDLLVVEGDPLADISVLTKPDEMLSVIMKGGEFYKNTL